MKRTIYKIMPSAIAMAMLWAGVLVFAPACASAEYTHLQRANNPKGCMACHGGSGVSRSGLLSYKSELLCYKCHGEESVTKGRPATNIEREMLKDSAHPVAETSHLHRLGEELPAKTGDSLRHTACQDCHLVHITTADKPWQGARGYDPGPSRGFSSGYPLGLNKKNADYEYELCYLCHSQTANAGLDIKDVSLEFNTSNASFHPVEGRGKNLNVPSLVRNLRETSEITCSSCHGSDNPMGPSGPHGSRYAPILKAEYQADRGPEGTVAYALCYTCHERMSILADESFKSHNLHVALNDAPCKSCHNAHGSELNRNLIDFDYMSVSAASDGSGPMYLDSFAGRPKCYLKCHDVDHNSSGIGGRPWPW